ncbi:phage tail assembly protein [Spartinivicinus ruber]|uniref:phage tail assembly protein n=1 Tax=Spartinivicinus ruber TaxID=2683272 RepID=UPI0013D260F0|nr:phage tail assembly protein [Spartinivicinus ruber]
MTQWTPEVYQLRWAITDDKDQPLTQVTLKPVNRKDHVNALKDKPEDNEALYRLAQLSCGLSISEIKRLNTPDWNSIKDKLIDLVSKGADYFFEKLGEDFDKDHPALLVPIKGDDDQLINNIDLKIPTVETSELMQAQKTTELRGLFITRACTGLSETEINRLAMPDWLHIQTRITDFLTETADCFPVETLTP